MPLTPTPKTQNFIKEVKALVNSGAVKNYSTIITALGMDKTLFSNVINGRKNVPNDVYRKFKEVYPDCIPEEKEEIKDIKGDSDLHSLIESNKLLASANKTMAETNSELAIMLKFNLVAPAASKAGLVPDLVTVLERIAQEGAKAALWASEGEGMKVLGKFLASPSKVKKSAGNEVGSGSTRN